MMDRRDMCQVNVSMNKKGSNRMNVWFYLSNENQMVTQLYAGSNQQHYSLFRAFVLEQEHMYRR